MAKPGFIYAFDNMEPAKFTELCGLLLGSRFKGFLLGGVGADGGVDGEVDNILGEWHPETLTALLNETVQAGQTIIFQFKHKVAARNGQTATRSQLLKLYDCDPKKPTSAKKCELHSQLVQSKNPTVYVLVTNVEVNSQFRNSFIHQCKQHNPSIKHYQVIGLDELESWITMEPELRHIYFPTIFGFPRFDLRIELRPSMLVYNTRAGIDIGDENILTINILNVGTVTSYISNLSSIKFWIIVDGERKCLTTLNIGDERYNAMNQDQGKPLEPGRKHSYNFFFKDLAGSLKKAGTKVFLSDISVYDEIGNEYNEPVPDNIRSFLK